MLKFTDEHVKRGGLSTSHENNVFSEYISSHIAQSIGLETHNTVIGMYKDEICVGCEDYRNNYTENLEFGEFLRMLYSSKDIKKIPLLSQIYEVYNSSVISDDLKKPAIQRFWDTFVVDALVGNFDRHTGNWVFLWDMKSDSISSLAPAYDFGSTLFPALSDDSIGVIINQPKEILERCFVYPSPVMYLTKEKVGKPGYYDMLASNYDSECTKALLRVFPKIDIEKINSIIDETPLISQKRKAFYKEMILHRYNLILKRAYFLCENEIYDEGALNRLKTGQSVTSKDVNDVYMNDISIIKSYEETHNLFKRNYTDEVNENIAEYIQNL